MPPKKTYCGVKKVPKGSRRGTAKECAEANQIRYYGRKKVDKETLNTPVKSTKKPKPKNKLLVEAKILELELKALDKKITNESDPKQKKKLKLQLKKKYDKYMNFLKSLKD